MVKIQLLDENPFVTNFKQRCYEICVFYNHTPSDEKLDDPTFLMKLPEGWKKDEEEQGLFTFFYHNIRQLDWNKLSIPKWEMGAGWWLLKGLEGNRDRFFLLWIYPFTIDLEGYDDYEIETLIYYYAPLHISNKGTNLGFQNFTLANEERPNYGYLWEDGDGWAKGNAQWRGIFLGKNGRSLPTPKPPMLNWIGWDF